MAIIYNDMKQHKFKFLLFNDETMIFRGVSLHEAVIKCLYYLVNNGMKADNRSIKIITDENGINYVPEFKLTISKL